MVFLSIWATGTRSHKPGDLEGRLINNRNVFLTVLETTKFKVKVPADLLPVKSLLPGLAVFSLCLQWYKRDRKLSEASL